MGRFTQVKKTVNIKEKQTARKSTCPRPAALRKPSTGDCNLNNPGFAIPKIEKLIEPETVTGTTKKLSRRYRYVFSLSY